MSVNSNGVIVKQEGCLNLKICSLVESMATFISLSEVISLITLILLFSSTTSIFAACTSKKYIRYCCKI